MAQKDLDRLADILLKKLQSSSNEFREIVTSKQVHEFHINETQIRKKVREELRDILGYTNISALPKEFEKIIKRETPKVTKEFHRLFTQAAIRSKTYNIKIIGTGTKVFSIIVESKTGRAKVYNYFRRIKQIAQKPMILAIDDAIASRGKGEKRLTKTRTDRQGRERRDVTSPFLDIGHDSQTTNASLRSKMAEEILLDFVSNAQSPLLNKYVAEIFEDIFVRVTKGPTTKSGRTIFKASLDSSKGNKSRALTDATNAGNLQKALNNLLEAQAQGFPNQPGSDTPVQAVEKTVLNELSKIGSKNKRVRNGVKKQKINTKPGKGESKPIRKKATIAPVIKERKSKLSSRSKQSRASKSTTSMVTLLGLLNQRLPQTVANNMGSPSLNNRTGRFASSVRVTDVVLTPQGFPSVGYTYQKSPYQTFEVGYKQGSTDLDPRKLIDKSIREIAAGLAMGRFYTRRV